RVSCRVSAYRFSDPRDVLVANTTCLGVVPRAPRSQFDGRNGGESGSLQRISGRWDVAQFCFFRHHDGLRLSSVLSVVRAHRGTVRRLVSHMENLARSGLSCCLSPGRTNALSSAPFANTICDQFQGRSVNMPYLRTASQEKVSRGPASYT